MNTVLHIDCDLVTYSVAKQPLSPEIKKIF